MSRGLGDVYKRQVVHDADPHPGDPSLAWSWRLHREIDTARAAIVLSEAVAQGLRRRAPSLPQIRATLPALLNGAAPAAEAAGSGRFLFFGRVRAYKGLDLLRDAFALLRARHPQVTLRVVGEGDPEGCAPGLSALPGVRVEPRWVAEGEIAALLASADAVVLPYREASQSGIVPQARAMGVPIVATPVGGLREQIGEGLGGILATAISAEALAAAMERALDPGEASRLRREAAAAASAAADWDSLAETLVSGLRRVLAA